MLLYLTLGVKTSSPSVLVFFFLFCYHIACIAFFCSLGLTVVCIRLTENCRVVNHQGVSLFCREECLNHRSIASPFHYVSTHSRNAHTGYWLVLHRLPLTISVEAGGQLGHVITQCSGQNSNNICLSGPVDVTDLQTCGIESGRRNWRSEKYLWAAVV